MTTQNQKKLSEDFSCVMKVCAVVSLISTVLNVLALMAAFNNASGSGPGDLHKDIPEIVARHGGNLSKTEKMALTANLTKQADQAEMNEITDIALATTTTLSLALLYGSLGLLARNEP